MSVAKPKVPDTYLLPGSWRAGAILALLVSPLLIIPLVAVPAFGGSLDRMALVGMALAVGLGIHDGIVVRESMVWHFELGLDRKAAARLGTAEIRGPLLSATIASFPLLLAPVVWCGLAASWVVPFGIMLTSAILLSATISLTVAPVLLSRCLPPHRAVGWVTRQLDRFEDRYHDALAGILDHSPLKAEIAVGTLALAVLVVAAAGRPELAVEPAVSGRVLIALGVAVMLTYLVLVYQLRSFLLPGSVLLGLPLVSGGALAGLFLTGHSLGVSGILGMVLGLGIAVRQVTILLTCARRRRTRGLSPRVALIDAGRMRLRPVLVATTVLAGGLVPLMGGNESLASFGAAAIGGLLAAALTVLLVIPAYSQVLTATADRRFGGITARRRPPSVPGPAAAAGRSSDRPGSTRARRN
jgi:multidrug efflux pump subunit AcrB